jgi:hypothetical protein
MKIVFASILIASMSAAAFAQTAAPAAKPAAKKAEPAKKAPVAKKAPSRLAIEEATAMSEPDPRIKLNEGQMAIARTVHTGDIKCELGAHVTIKAMKRDGFFFVTHGINRFVMHPVESRTGAIRLEDPVRGALWLQIANKSMLMNQKEGKRLADECQSPQQVAFAKDMKAVNLLEPAPAAATAQKANAGQPTAP